MARQTCHETLSDFTGMVCFWAVRETCMFIFIISRYFLVDFYSPTTTVESMMEHLSRDIDVIRRNIVRHPLTQEVKACEGIVPVPLEEKLYSTKKKK